MSIAPDLCLSKRLTIAITTKNRWDDLLETLHQLEALGLQNCPMIVIDDGSDHPAPESVRRDLRNQRLIRFEQSEGLVAQRNRLAELTTTSYMMSIDDDSAPMSVEGLSGVIEKMDSNLAVGVVGFPILLKSGAIAQSGRGDWPESSTYVGCGHIIRVSTFRELGGYWGDLVYWGEERDYSLRLLAAGHKVLESCKPVIFHRVSSNGRSSSRLCYLRARNTLLIWYHRVPLVLLPFVITRAILGILSSYVRERDLLIASLRGMADAFRAVLKGKTGTKSSSRLSLRQWFYWRKLI